MRRAALAALIAFATGCGGEREAAAPADAADGLARAPAAPGVDPAERERLGALGYVDVGEPLAPEAATGLISLDVERAAPGTTLLVHVHVCRAELIDLYGSVLRSWTARPCGQWGHAVLAPDGDLIAVGRDPHRADADAKREARYLLRLGWSGERRWRRDLPAHHDVEVAPDDRIFSLTYEHRAIPEVHPEIATRDHAIVELSPQGELLDEVSIYELAAAAPEVLPLHAVAPRLDEDTLEIDLLHANSVEWLRHPVRLDDGPPLAGPLLLVGLRSQDSAVLVDWAAKRLVWSWGKGEVSAPHDATWLPSGNLLFFDNGHGRDWSRVVEVDPRRREIVWEYRASEPESFFTLTRGGSQRLSNGNTLITESGKGRVIEVTADGEIVWEYRTPLLTSKREPGVIVRARRFESLSTDALGRLAAEGLLPWVD